MIRKTLLAAIALLVVAASALAVEAPTQANGVRPVYGKYVGEDHGDLNISFHFDGSDVRAFKVGHHEIGAARVSDGVWHETCRDGYCIKGHWQLDFHVVGYWRSPSGEWTAFHASVPEGLRAITPLPGAYIGGDDRGSQVAFHYDDRDGSIGHFNVDHRMLRVYPRVSGSRWDDCGGDVCAKGHWTDERNVSGAWRNGGDWVHFSVSLHVPVTLDSGKYTTETSGLLAVELTYRHGRIEIIRGAGQVWGRDIPVTGRNFEFCGHDVCFRGQWHTSTHIFGTWRQLTNQQHGWHRFDVMRTS